MLSIEEIQAALRDRRITAISNATGVHRNTITNIRDKGADANPTYAVLKSLSDYLAGGAA
jgi:hypothetical protein